MNNEPVAWIAYDEFGDFMLEATPEGDYPWQPLYTHPAKTLEPDLYSEDGFPLWTSPQFKTLTDKEILKVYWNMQISIETHEGVFAFARAILRKAQEK